MSDVPPPPFPPSPSAPPPGAPAPAPRRGLPGWLVGAIAVVAVLVVLGAVGVATSKDDRGGARPAAGAGCGTIADHPIPEAAKHVEGPIAYDTKPPHGGEHNPTWLPAFQKVIRRGSAPDLVVERAVHNLEHAYVVVWYGDDVRDEDLDAVAGAVADANLPKVLVVPYPGTLDTPFALAAWGHVQHCEQPDEAALRAFWDLHGGPNGDAPEKNAP